MARSILKPTYSSIQMTREEFIEKLKEHNLDHHLQSFEAVTRNCIRLYLSQEDERDIPLGASKMGGRPDLPPSIAWPFETERPPSDQDRLFNQNQVEKPLLPLSFIAQINVSEVSAMDEERLLPDAGMLYFFYAAEQDVWGFDPRDRSGFAVFYFDGDMSDLCRADFPETIPAHAKYKPCSVSLRKEVSLKTADYDPYQFLTREEQDLFDRKIYKDGIINKLLGHSDNIQDDMELECELVTNGLYCGNPDGYEDPRRKALEANAGDWRLLLQVDSNETDCGMTWGDVGRIYYWIKKDDLFNKQFDRSWFVFQCS